jgi:hypothetical protein
MARGKRYRNITIHPAQGGALIGSASDDVPITQESNYLSSSANYTDKLNFRRETDGELRREGWEELDLSGGSSKWGGVAFDINTSNLPIRAIHQFPGTDGEAVIVAIAGNVAWRLFSSEDTYAKDYSNEDNKYAVDSSGNEYWASADDDFYWKEIYVFGNNIDLGTANRWEIVDVQNHIIINNGVDLPVVYKSEYERAEPLYSLRENGIVSVGTISSYQDRLFCADLLMITDGFDRWFTGASNPYGDVYTSDLYGQVKVKRYQYRMAYSAEGEPKLFNAGVISGNSVVMESGGLPGTLTVNSAGQYAFNSEYQFAINTPASMYQLLNDGAYQGPEAYTVNMVNPIATIKTTYEDPDDLNISGIYLTTNEASVSDEYTQDPANPFSLYVDEGYYESFGGDYKLVNQDGADMIFKDPTTAENLAVGTYNVVLRPYAEQLSSPAAFNEFAQDGSRILKMHDLADKLVVYRESGFFFLSKTNSTALPFSVEPRYTGGRIADFRHTIINIDGRQHIFMGNSGIYAINRSSTEPTPVSIFEIGPPFWQTVPPELSEYIYAVDNPITREIFINCPTGILLDSDGNYIDQKGNPSPTPKLEWGTVAYDYINKTLSTIDASFTSAASIRKPRFRRTGSDELWFVMGIHQSGAGNNVYPGTQYRTDNNFGGVLVRYGYGPPKQGERSPYRLYSRLGLGYSSVLKSGLIDFGDSFSDKEVRSYVLELSSKYGTTPTRVKISTTTSPQGTENVETMQVVDGVEIDYVELNNLVDENMIPMYVRAPYIRDEITVLPEYNEDGSVKDNPIKITGRTFEVSGVDSRSTTQAYNQG